MAVDALVNRSRDAVRVDEQDGDPRRARCRNCDRKTRARYDYGEWSGGAGRDRTWGDSTPARAAEGLEQRQGRRAPLWAFYTLRAGVVHGVERRLGMGPAYIGEDGELHVKPPSSTPQRITGTPEGAVAAGWVPLDANRWTSAITAAGNLSSRLAVDNDLRTWWQPQAGDAVPALTSALVSNATVRAIRIVWRDIGLNTAKGVAPGPFRYKVEVQNGSGSWVTALDRGNSAEDFLVDYRECPPTPGKAARLVIVGAPKGITPGVAEFTVFGEAAKR